MRTVLGNYSIHMDQGVYLRQVYVVVQMFTFESKRGKVHTIGKLRQTEEVRLEHKEQLPPPPFFSHLGRLKDNRTSKRHSDKLQGDPKLEKVPFVTDCIYVKHLSYLNFEDLELVYVTRYTTVNLYNVCRDDPSCHDSPRNHSKPRRYSGFSSPVRITIRSQKVKRSFHFFCFDQKGQRHQVDVGIYTTPEK